MVLMGLKKTHQNPERPWVLAETQREPGGNPGRNPPASAVTGFQGARNPVSTVFHDEACLEHER